MGLDVPELDDTDYEELLDEAQKLLPAYSEAWTNFNPQDPGITTLETLAWLTDSYVYQLDSVTDRHRHKYLQLMGESPRPPRPARTQVVLDPPAAATPLAVPAGTQLTVVDGSDTEKTFETAADLVVTGTTVRSVVSACGDARTDHAHANETRGMFYRPLGEAPSPGDAMAVGVDGDPFAGGEAETLSVTVAFHDEGLPDPATYGDEPATFDPSVELVWEYCTDYAAGTWEPFDVVRDGTDSLYREGTVVLAAPDEWAPDEWADAELYGRSDLVWVRCRVETGGYEFPPRVDSVALDVVPATNRRTVEGEPLRRVRGTEGPATLTEQRFRFEHAPVVEATVSVDGERWTPVESFDASAPTDTHYVLDRAEGVVRFGDGTAGVLPDPDARVVAERYVTVDGAAGNVPASAAWSFAEGETAADGTDLSSVAVRPRWGASGGTDAESLVQAFRRVRRDLDRPHRAVTADDMAYLARNTPGLGVARATVVMVPREDAGPDAPPEARVVVVPDAPPTVAAPTPSAGFLDAVQSHLDEHRLLTDRVRAVEPTYVELSVEASVQAVGRRPAPGADADVVDAIEASLHPIEGYEGEGWPFGRPLYAEDLAAVVAGVDWVGTVDELSVTARGNARVDSDGNVRVDDAALFALADLELDVTAGGRRDGADGRGRD